ncbi:MAG: hypothetical protein WC732_07715 [Candidatus Omnitrophota bacterium]
MKNSGKKAVLWFAAAVLCLAFATPALAGLRIDKPKVRLLIKPGSYASDEIKVENTGKETMAVKVYLEDWVYSQQDGAKDFFPKGSTPLSCSPWMTFYPADLKLEAGKTAMVRYTVNVPADARGGHYCVMFFETAGGDIEQDTPEGTTAFIKVLNRVGALFYVEAEGTVEKKAELRNIRINQKLNDFIVSAEFANTGNTDITAQGTFDVLDASGVVYARGAFQEVYTLAGDKASLQASAFSVNLQPGPYDILMTLDFQNGGSLIQEANFTVGARGEVQDIRLK